jgi:hypothetical protein
VIGPVAARHLRVKQFQPQHGPRRATGEQLLREGRRTTDMRNKLGLAAAKKLSFFRTTIDRVADDAASTRTAMGLNDAPSRG